jgi:hypothetical protein
MAVLDTAIHAFLALLLTALLLIVSFNGIFFTIYTRRMGLTHTSRQCEERSEEAIHLLKQNKKMDCHGRYAA